MKKQLFLAGSLLALLAVSSCTKDEFIESIETPQSEIPEGYFKPVLKADFNSIANHPLNEAQSRHHVGMDGKANWVEGDTLLVAVLKVTDLEDNNLNEFLSGIAPLHTFLYSASGDFEQDPKEAKLILSNNIEYKWISVNPGLQDKSIQYERNEEGVFMEDKLHVIGTSFYSTTQSATEPEKHLAKLDELLGSCSTVGNPSIVMKHIGTLMKFKIKNQTGSPFKLQGFRLESSDNLCPINGDFSYDAYSTPSTEVKIDNECTIAAGGSFTVATIVNEFSLKTKDVVTIHVKTDQGIFKKEYPMKQDIVFGAGTWSLANVEVESEGMVNYGDDNVYIPDANFRKALIQACGKQDSDPLTKADLEGITTLVIQNQGISTLEGLEYLKNLSNLELCSCSISNIDLSQNTKLENLNLQDNLLRNLNIDKNESLTILKAYDNLLDNINLENLTELESLDLSNNELTSINLDNAHKLAYLSLNNNKLTNVDTQKNPKLATFSAANNQLTSLNFQKNPELDTFRAANNQLTSLDFQKNKKLKILNANGNLLTSLNIKNNTQLHTIMVSNNQLTEIDISNCDQKIGIVWNNPFIASDNPNLHTIWVWKGFHDISHNACDPKVTKDLYKVKGKYDSNFDIDDFESGNEDFL